MKLKHYLKLFIGVVAFSTSITSIDKARAQETPIGYIPNTTAPIYRPMVTTLSFQDTARNPNSIVYLLFKTLENCSIEGTIKYHGNTYCSDAVLAQNKVQDGNIIMISISEKDFSATQLKKQLSFKNLIETKFGFYSPVSSVDKFGYFGIVETGVFVASPSPCYKAERLNNYVVKLRGGHCPEDNANKSPLINSPTKQQAGSSNGVQGGSAGNNNTAAAIPKSGYPAKSDFDGNGTIWEKEAGLKITYPQGWRLTTTVETNLPAFIKSYANGAYLLCGPNSRRWNEEGDFDRCGITSELASKRSFINSQNAKISICNFGRVWSSQTGKHWRSTIISTPTARGVIKNHLCTIQAPNEVALDMAFRNDIDGDIETYVSNIQIIGFNPSMNPNASGTGNMPRASNPNPAQPINNGWATERNGYGNVILNNVKVGKNVVCGFETKILDVENFERRAENCNSPFQMEWIKQSTSNNGSPLSFCKTIAKKISGEYIIRFSGIAHGKYGEKPTFAVCQFNHKNKKALISQTQADTENMVLELFKNIQTKSEQGAEPTFAVKNLVSLKAWQAPTDSEYEIGQDIDPVVVAAGCPAFDENGILDKSGRTTIGCPIAPVRMFVSDKNGDEFVSNIIAVQDDSEFLGKSTNRPQDWNSRLGTYLFVRDLNTDKNDKIEPRFYRLGKINYGEGLKFANAQIKISNISIASIESGGAEVTILNGKSAFNFHCNGKVCIATNSTPAQSNVVNAPISQAQKATTTTLPKSGKIVNLNGKKICGRAIPVAIHKGAELTAAQCATQISFARPVNGFTSLIFGVNENGEYCGSSGCVAFLWGVRADGGAVSIGLGYNLYEVRAVKGMGEMPDFIINQRAEMGGGKTDEIRLKFNPKSRQYESMQYE